MGLFSSKNLIAELNIGLLSKNKVFVSIKNIPVENNIEMFKKSKLPFIIYMFFLDRILGNMSEKTSAAILHSIHTLATQYINIISENMNPFEWQKTKLKLKTPNQWTFTDSEDDFLKAGFKATAKIYQKGDRIFCETDFSKDPLMEAKAYLLAESLLSFVTQKSNYEDYSLYFLPALLAQCSYYDGKRPGITQLGQAVHYGLTQAVDPLEIDLDIESLFEDEDDQK